MRSIQSTDNTSLGGGACSSVSQQNLWGASDLLLYGHTSGRSRLHVSAGDVLRAGGDPEIARSSTTRWLFSGRFSGAWTSTGRRSAGCAASRCWHTESDPENTPRATATVLKTIMLLAGLPDRDLLRHTERPPGGDCGGPRDGDRVLRGLVVHASDARRDSGGNRIYGRAFAEARAAKRANTA